MKSNEERLQDLLAYVDSLTRVHPSEIPGIDLYMDQVTTFMDSHLNTSKWLGEDKILTKTMINNYAKNNLLPPPVKKRYSKNHLLMLILIYYFKNVISFRDIEQLFSPISEHHFSHGSSPELEELYNEIFSLEKGQRKRLQEDVMAKFDAASQQPKWMLLSYRKAVTASSTAEGSDPVNAVDEDCRRWWSAGSDQPGEWLCVDLGRDCDVRAVQVNMADEKLVVDFPADSYGDDRKTRHIETRPQISHYNVETSLDGKVWTLREDVARECSNGYYEFADGIRARYIRVTGGELPYGQALRISGLRVFGNGEGACPAQADAKVVRVDALDGKISWQHIENAQGCNVRYGIAPDKLYQSWLVYDADEVTLSTLMAGQTYYVCVDSFNENGITTGKIIKMEG